MIANAGAEQVLVVIVCETFLVRRYGRTDLALAFVIYETKSFLLSCRFCDYQTYMSHV